jgi:hypothetical protein
LEAKVEMISYHGEKDVENLNSWLKKVDIYFNMHRIREEHQISFIDLKMFGNDLIYWER